MRIRSTLRINSMVSILVMAISLGGTLTSYYWLRQASSFEKVLIDLQSDIFERTTLRDDFLVSRGPQALNRWTLKTAEVGGHLKRLSQLPLKGSKTKHLQRMNHNFKASSLLLGRIVDLRQVTVATPSGRTVAGAIEQRLTNQLLVDVYLLSDSTKQLLLEARNDTVQARNQLLLLLCLSTLALGFTVSYSNFFLNRRLADRIVKLRDGLVELSAGRLGSRLQVAGDDELSELAQEVNTMAEKLEQSYELLELSNHELEAFSYSVSHDLRAPLRHLIGFVELLGRVDNSELDEKSKHYLEVISSSAKKMGRLIDDLLAFSRIGHAELTRSLVNLSAIAREVVEEISKDLPPGDATQWRLGSLPTVTGDRAMLRLVFVNLVSNAVKFTRGRASPLIELGALPLDGPLRTLFVRDNGVGFNMKYVDKLFCLFQRLHSTEEFEGTGVGLANVRRIIDRHGGTTWAEGELDKGATFYFTIPHAKESQS